MAEQVKDLRDYYAILAKRKKYFIIPFVGLFILVTVIAYLWPPTYESSSTILIETQQIPEDFVRSTVTGYADERIQSLTQQILSRSKLWEIVQQFHLYPKLQEKLTREEILEKMRDDIRLDTISADIVAPTQGSKKRGVSHATAAQITIAFSIAYQGRNPDTVQKVDSTLASLYLEQNLKTREAQAKTTTEFLEAESKGLKERIQLLGDKIAAFKKEHEGIQPELQQFNLIQADRLDQDIKQIDNQMRNAEDRRIYLEGQLATVKPDTPIIGSSGERVMDPQSRLRYLQVMLADLQSKFCDDHPDILKVKREMAELEKLAGQQGGSPSLKRQKLTQLRAELAEKQGKYSPDHPDIKKLKTEIARLEQQPEKTEPVKPVAEAENPAYVTLTTQIESAKTEVSSLQRQREALKGKLKVFNQRLEETPKLEQEYLDLMRDYTYAADKYKEVTYKILEARISEGMEEHQKGEKFTLIDPASYPEKPVSPKRWLIILAGFIISLGSGLVAVALAEQMDHSLERARDLTSLTGLPVLGTIIRIVTKEDLIRAKRRRRFVWAATGVSLFLGLTLFHLLYMDLWVLTATLLRLINKYT
jgi:succinoglycan biosynthesis transport protein ExoP